MFWTLAVGIELVEEICAAAVAFTVREVVAVCAMVCVLIGVELGVPVTSSGGVVRWVVGIGAHAPDSSVWYPLPQEKLHATVQTNG